MSDEEFQSRYLGKWPEDPILKAFKKSYVAVADKNNLLFLPQSIIKQGIDSIKYGAKPEEVLCGVLEAMGSLINQMHKVEITRARLEVKPIVVIKPDEPK